MGNLKIPDYRDDIEETILPDNDGKKEESVQSTVTPDSDNGTDNTEVVNEKVSRKSFAAVVTDRIFELLVIAGQYFCHIIADIFSKPAIYVAHGAKFLWKHTALFRDAVK